ncbi:dynamin family protein [Frankia sp. Cas4]|uniref:dynamin family protein n=1 Tax=Frankia sp. Cas4 TaxID=3073927 RepID=UPI002AD1D77A|nr:dynamin family protein [Frankia sp. Cas4]
MSAVAADPPEASLLDTSLLDAVIREAGRHRRADLQARLARERTRLTATSCQVVVVGEFKKGKSSLVNALLNLQVCAVDPIGATMMPTMIQHAPARTETVIDQSAGCGVEIGVPNELLASGLIIVDTPGVNGGLTDARAAATLRAVSDADAVVFVSDASQEYTEPELAFLRGAAQHCPVVVCALTKIDFYPEWRRILDLDRGHLHRVGIAAPVFPLSAPLRDHGLRADAPEVDAESGYPAFAVHIRSELVEQCRARARRDADEAARDALAQIMAELVVERAARADPAVRNTLRLRLEAAQARAHTMTTAAARWQRILRDGNTQLERRVDDDLNQRLQAVTGEFRKRVATSADLVQGWDELRAWLCEQANRELMAHRTMLRAEAAALAEQVVSVFHTDEAATSALPEIPAMTSLASLASLASPTSGRPAAEGTDPQFRTDGRGARWTQALRSGAIGMMPIHLLAAFGALAGLSLAPIVAPVGGAVMFVVAKRTLRTSRENQLSTHRAQAKGAGEDYLQKAWQLAHTDSRRAQQDIYFQLGNVFTERAAELRTSAGRNLESAALEIKATDVRSQRRLAELNTEINRLELLAGQRR